MLGIYNPTNNIFGNGLMGGRGSRGNTGMLGLGDTSPAPSDIDFLTGLYTNLLGRQADPKGFNFWMTQLANGTVTRNTIEQDFLTSSEYQTRLNGSSASTTPNATVNTTNQTNQTGAVLAVIPTASNTSVNTSMAIPDTSSTTTTNVFSDFLSGAGALFSPSEWGSVVQSGDVPAIIGLLSIPAVAFMMFHKKGRR